MIFTLKLFVCVRERFDVVLFITADEVRGSRIGRSPGGPVSRPQRYLPSGRARKAPNLARERHCRILRARAGGLPRPNLTT